MVPKVGTCYLFYINWIREEMRNSRGISPMIRLIHGITLRQTTRPEEPHLRQPPYPTALDPHDCLVHLYATLMRPSMVAP